MTWLLGLIIAAATGILAFISFRGIRRFILPEERLREELKELKEEEASAREFSATLRNNLLKVSSWLVVLVILFIGISLILHFSGFNLEVIFTPLINWLLGPGLRFIAIVLVAGLLLRLIDILPDSLMRAFLRQKVTTIEEEKRFITLKNIIDNILRVLIVLVATIMALKELGFDVTALLTAAGIGGLALSLGAQDLIRDYISGFFLLVEDQVRVGDVADINGFSGTVEEMTLRTLTLRALDGTATIIPNRQITAVSNMTKSFSRYVIDIEVAYKENVDEVMAVLKEIGEGLVTDPVFKSDILEPLEILGVDDFSASGVNIKIMITTKPLQQWVVGRELRRRIKNTFDEKGIEIPFPHLSLYWGSASQPLEVELKEKKN